MLVLVVYDIEMKTDSDKSRLRKIAKLCERFGTRVQNSVFEMILDNRQYIDFKNTIQITIDIDKDSVRFYLLGNSWKQNVDVIGKKNPENADSVLIM